MKSLLMKFGIASYELYCELFFSCWLVFVFLVVDEKSAAFKCPKLIKFKITTLRRYREIDMKKEAILKSKRAVHAHGNFLIYSKLEIFLIFFND